MAKKKDDNKIYLKNGKEYTGELPLHTQIEVVAVKGDKVVKTVMSLDDALCMEKKVGWKYTNSQIGFCSIPENK